MELVNLLKEFLSLLKGIPAGGGKGSQAVPLVTDSLAAAINGGRVIVVQSIELLGNGCNLFYTVLRIEILCETCTFLVYLSNDRYSNDFCPITWLNGHASTWWAARSDSKASCFFLRALSSLSLQCLKSWLCNISSFPAVHDSWISALCLNFLARCSRRSSLKSNR